MKRFAKAAAVGMRIGADAAIAFGCKRGDVGFEAPSLIEELFGFITALPFFELGEMRLVLLGIGDRNLMRAPEVLDFVTVDFLGSGPAFWRAEDDHGPARAEGFAGRAGLLLILPDFGDHLFERGRHLLMHGGRIR